MPCELPPPPPSPAFQLLTCRSHEITMATRPLKSRCHCQGNLSRRGSQPYESLIIERQAVPVPYTTHYLKGLDLNPLTPRRNATNPTAADLAADAGEQVHGSRGGDFPPPVSYPHGGPGSGHARPRTRPPPASAGGPYPGHHPETHPAGLTQTKREHQRHVKRQVLVTCIPCVCTWQVCVFKGADSGPTK